MGRGVLWQSDLRVSWRAFSGSHYHSWAGCRGDFIDAAALRVMPVMDDTTVAGRV